MMPGVLLTLLLVVSPWHEFLVIFDKRLGVWDDLVLALLGLWALAARRFPRPLLVIWAVTLLSALLHASAWPTLRAFLPYSLALPAAAMLRSRKEVLQLCRWWLYSATLAVLYSLASYLTFRAMGGGYNLRPNAWSLWEQALLLPYNCGIYPRGWRLCGTFLNDNYFGAWCGALFCLALALRQRLLILPFLLAWAWTFSRSAMIGLALGLLVLAWRLTPRVLWLVPLAMVLSWPFLSQRDLVRLRHPLATEGGRLHSIQMSMAVLGQGSLLGRGPGSRGLADMQYAKIAYELGWLGVAAFAWLGWWMFRPLHTSKDPLVVGLAASLACLLGMGVGGEILEVPQVAVCVWTIAGLLQVSAGSAAGEDLHGANVGPEDGNPAD